MDTPLCEHPFNRLHWVGVTVFCNKCKTTLVKSEEPLTYTEQEVYTMLVKLQIAFPIHRLIQITPMELKSWFENNKKKDKKSQVHGIEDRIGLGER